MSDEPKGGDRPAPGGPSSSESSGQGLAAAFVEVLAEAIERHRPRARSDKGALVVRLAGPGAVAHTILWEGEKVMLLGGAVAPPGTESAELDVGIDALKAFGSGKSPAAALASSGEVSVRGGRRVLSDLAACFAPAASPLGVRLGQRGGQTDS